MVMYGWIDAKRWLNISCSGKMIKVQGSTIENPECNQMINHYPRNLSHSTIPDDMSRLEGNLAVLRPQLRLSTDSISNDPQSLRLHILPTPPRKFLPLKPNNPKNRLRIQGAESLHKHHLPPHLIVLSMLENLV